jgi:hypothetical protein
MREPRAVGGVLAVLVVLAGVGPATAAAPARTATETGIGGVESDQFSVTTAGVNVSLEPNRTSVDAGNTTTFDVVVSGADRGVGVFDVTVQTGDAAVAPIDGASLQLGSTTEVNDTRARLQNVRDSTDASTVTIATVTVRGETDGTAALNVSVDTLADANDDPYDSVETGAATVEVTGTAVQLALAANRTSVPAGGAVEFTVRRADTGETVTSTVTVAGRSHDTGDDGRVAVAFESEGTYTATASKAGDYLNDSLEVTVGSGRSAVTVSLEPASGDVAAGDRTVFRIVADGFANGIRSVDIVVNTTDVSVAPIVTASPRIDGTFSSATVDDDGTGMRIRVVGADTSQTGPVVVARLRVEGAAVGIAGLAIGLDGNVVVGDEDDQEYPIEERRNASVTVERRQVDLALALNRTNATTGETVSATVTRTDTGEPVNATVHADRTARTTGEDGRAPLQFDTAGEYPVTASKADTSTETYTNATATVRVVVAGPGRDLDGDGRHEDVNADGEFSVLDVAVLLERFEDEPFQSHAARFDFEPDGSLNVLDVAALLAGT